MPHTPLESVRISESSNIERTVIPFSPEDGVLIVRCGGVEKANGEYHWNTERRAWQKTGFIISCTRRAPGLTPILWEGQGRWKLCMCCNDKEGGGGHFDVLYFSVPTDGNLPFMNDWRSVAPEHLPPPVISLVEICNDKNMLTCKHEELVLPPYVHTESSFHPFEFSYKGTADDNSDKTMPCIVLKRRVTPCHVKILEGKDASWCSGLSAQNTSTESFSNLYIEAVKKEEERYLSTEWALPVISSSSMDEQISSLYRNLENSLEEVQCAIFNMVEELKKAKDSIIFESEEETFLRVVSSLNPSDQEGTPSPTSIMEADVDMTNMNLEDNNSLLWSMVEAKENILFDSWLDGKRRSRSRDTNVEHLSEEQSWVKTTPPLSNDQHASANNVPLPMWKWSVRNRINYALEDKRLPLFIDVLVFDSTNAVVNEIESSLSFHPPNSSSYVIRSTFQHHEFETSCPHMDHSGSNGDLRALEDFVQLLQSLQWRSMVVRLDLNQLCILHASLAAAIRDETHTHLPPFPSPYDLGSLEQMATDTSSNTLEGDAVRVAAYTAADLIQRYMTDILAFARALPHGPERDAFTASLTLTLCNPEGTVAAPVVCSFNFEWCNDGSGEQGNAKHQEKRNNKNLLKRQNMRCAGCGTTLMRCSHGLFNIANRKYDSCLVVNGLFFCRQFCHHGSKRIIPHRVIQFGDFSYHRVSDVAAKILDEIWALPLVSLKVGHYLYDVEVSKTWKLRQRIVALYQNKKLSGEECCHLETSLSHVLGNRMHLYISDNFWSLEDLTGIQNGSLNYLLQNVLKELQPGIELDNFG